VTPFRCPKQKLLRIESKTVNVNTDQKALYSYISDLRNFNELLPQERISNFQADENQCSFKIQGGYTIGLERAGGTPDSLLKLKSTAVAPFPFTLDISLNDQGVSTQASQVINADVNPFIKMMIEKPLTNLFDYIADQLVKKFQ
jgi:hypothetical protein